MDRGRKAEGGRSSGQWPVVSDRRSVHHSSFSVPFLPPSAFRLPPSAFRLPPSAFTLTELLVTITIISILAAMVLGAVHAAGEAGKEYATKATIAKLNDIIMERYESYMTRRVCFDTSTLTPAQIQQADQIARANPKVAARYRLDAIRDTMRMEMPDSRADVVDPPISFLWGKVPDPALRQLYNSNPPTADNDSAQCLYMVVSMGSPEAMEQFSQNEIGTITSGGATHPVFIDGWGTPIRWLRWAPGFISPNSDIQTGNPVADSDPFDSRRVDVDASNPPQPRSFHLIPLICSAGPDKIFGISDLSDLDNPTRGTPLTSITLFDSSPTPILGTPTGTTHYDNITNHHIEQR